MLIGSTSLFGAANYNQGVSAANIVAPAAINSDAFNTMNSDNAANRNEKSRDQGTAVRDGLTDSQRFTMRHAGLGASDYISAYFDFAEQNSANLLKSGQATDTFKVNFESRTYTLAGTKLGGLNFQGAQLSDAMTVSVAQAGAPRAAIDMTA